MNSLILALIMAIGYLIAYHTYGKFIAKKIFRIDPSAVCPSEAMRDDQDYVPTGKHVLFGHHFTSIAGLGPIVGPAIGIIWGWVPAALWVLFGSVFMGAVHDFGALIISLRGKGRSVGDLAADIINPRVRTLFLLIIFFELWIVIAVFALIIGILFTMYPETVFPVWLEIPIAMVLGHMVYKKSKNATLAGIVAVIVMYITVVIGAYLPFKMPALFGLNPLAVWIVVLLTYAFFASTLPVQILLQPRDYINSYQLLIAMALLGIGTLFTHPKIVAPALNLNAPGAPPVWPFLFVVIACGAISGFHSLVSSGTSSKQCDSEKSALFIGYGSMLVEGALGILVIIAVGAGLSMGLKTTDGEMLTGTAAFSHHYRSWAAAQGLTSKLAAFVTGSSNMLNAVGIPAKITMTLMGVFLVSFAATTLDSATRIQRYVVSELAGAIRIDALKGKKTATLFAVVTAFMLAFSNGSGKGALTLWPLFGTVNQLMAGLALLVITIYLARKKAPVVYTLVPMLFMIVLTLWAMLIKLEDFYTAGNWMLLSIGAVVLALEIWMITESALVLRNINRKEIK